MKLRIRKNAIRLRLKQSEVEKIASGQSIVEQTCFPGSVLTYRLEVADDHKFSASFDGGDMRICLPESQIMEWAQTDQVSIFAEQSPGESDALSVLVEKDFKCLAPGHHRSGEDDLDTYPHPNSESGNGC